MICCLVLIFLPKTSPYNPIYHKPFDPVGELDSSTGTLELATDEVLTCESKDGSVGAEEIQCWQTDAGDNPVIMTFKDVKSLQFDSSQRRLLSKNDERMLESPVYSAEFNCIQNDIHVS